MSSRALIDTNVFISSLISVDRAPSHVIRLCLQGHIKPIMGSALYLEYCDLFKRKKIFEKSALNEEERLVLFDAFISVCDWVSIYYLWRPNLRDEGDNHILELAVSGHAEYVITGNKKDFQRNDLLFPDINIITPGEFIERSI